MGIENILSFAIFGLVIYVTVLEKKIKGLKKHYLSILDEMIFDVQKIESEEDIIHIIHAYQQEIENRKKQFWISYYFKKTKNIIMRKR